jgi:hypothetical protein
MNGGTSLLLASNLLTCFKYVLHDGEHLPCMAILTVYRVERQGTTRRVSSDDFQGTPSRHPHIFIVTLNRLANPFSFSGGSGITGLNLMVGSTRVRIQECAPHMITNNDHSFFL